MNGSGPDGSGLDGLTDSRYNGHDNWQWERTRYFMKLTGIIAEYNPFHKGHQYHIEETRKQTGADYVIAVMSGDYVQRGEPAIADKYMRTRMAHQCVLMRIS